MLNQCSRSQCAVQCLFVGINLRSWTQSILMSKTFFFSAKRKYSQQREEERIVWHHLLEASAILAIVCCSRFDSNSTLCGRRQSTIEVAGHMWHFNYEQQTDAQRTEQRIEMIITYFSEIISWECILWPSISRTNTQFIALRVCVCVRPMCVESFNVYVNIYYVWCALQLRRRRSLENIFIIQLYTI